MNFAHEFEVSPTTGHTSFMTVEPRHACSIDMII